MPADGRTSPMMVFMRVDLPAPFAPTTATSSPSADLDRDPAERVDVPVVDMDGPPDPQHATALRGMAEIGLDDALDLLDLLRRPLGNLHAVVEHGHAVRDLHHEVHVVLDQEHGDAPVTDAPDQAVDHLDLLAVEPRRGLVEEKEPRADGEGAGDLEHALLPVRQGGGDRLRLLPEPDLAQQRHGGVAEDPLVLCSEAKRWTGRHRPEPGAAREVRAGEDVVQHAHLAEELEVLEGAAQPRRAPSRWGGQPFTISP